MQKHIIQLGKYIYAFLKGIWILQLLSPPGAQGIVWQGKSLLQII